MTVLRDVSHRRADFAVIEMQRKWRWRLSDPGVRYQDVADRFGVFLQFVPDTKHAEHARGGIGYRADAAIELRRECLCDGKRIGQQNFKPALRKRDGKGQPDHAAAGDHNLRTVSPHLPGVARKESAPRYARGADIRSQ